MTDVAHSAAADGDVQGEQVFSLPDLGEGLTEAEILAWLVGPGDQVGVDDLVVEVETAKAAVEVPCPYAGTVVAVHGDVGDVIEVGKPLITVRAPDDPAARTAESHRSEERAGSGAVLVGYGTAHGSSSTRRHVRRRGLRKPPAPAVAPRVISPVVRRLARDAGLDINAVTGTGPGGIVLREDIISALAGRPTHSAAVPSGAATRVPLKGVRRAIADKLSRSRREIPDATTWVDVDATGLVEWRESLRATHPSVGLMALLARIVVAGLARFPELNASVEGDEIVQHGVVNLGFAAQTDRGLVVPVVRDAHRRSTAELGAEIARLTALARDGKLEPADLTGGTVTLNNYGVFGVDGSTPIINHPEAALLGVGRIVEKPWVVDGQLAVRKVTQLSLTFDHRVCDGGTAGGFLRFAADCVERPATLLADL